MALSTGAPDSRSIARDLELTDEEISHRKAFLGYGEEDVARRFCIARAAS